MEFRDLPSVHELLDSDWFQPLNNQYSRDLVRDAIREEIDHLRDKINDIAHDRIEPENLAHQVRFRIQGYFKKSLIGVINATGTVLHTNLGRAPLAADALEAVIQVSRGYSNLEFNLDSGSRGHRSDHLSNLICRLTGAEAAIAVNNNAGAVLLSLAALVRDQEVIVSRGELIEIGGGFRIPDVMAASGAILKEVGTTNRTHLADYEIAINENTGMLFKAHYSNFGMVGFTKEVTLSELVTLGQSRKIPVMFDLGSGCIADGSEHGWYSTPVAQTLEDGADLVTFSGDKLLGGPQAGIIVGKSKFIEKISKHPMARALRLDKMTLAALEATLRLYLRPDRIWETIPALRMLSVSENTLKKRASRLTRQLRKLKSQQVLIQTARSKSAVGGGALPLADLPTWSVKLSFPTGNPMRVQDKLRKTSPPVICRVQDDFLILDMRTVSNGEIKALVDALRQILIN